MEEKIKYKRGLRREAKIIDDLSKIPCQSFQFENFLEERFEIHVRNNDGSYRIFSDVLSDAAKIYWTLNEEMRNVLKSLLVGNSWSKKLFEEYMKK